MVRLGTIAACLILFTGSAFAAPVRYEIRSEQDQGVKISGFVEFLDPGMGVTSFSLADTDAFEIVASGPGLSTLVYNNAQGIVDADDAISFDAALGDLSLTPLGLPGVRRWQGRGDLDGQGDGDDAIELRTANNSVTWFVWEDGFVTLDFTVGGAANVDPVAWHLVNEVPEPGSLLLLSPVAVLLWRRRAAVRARS